MVGRHREGEEGRSMIWELDMAQREKAELSGLLPSESAMRYTN